eukprot:EG_transcript_38851
MELLPKQVIVNDPNVCLDWVHGRCTRDQCRFAHDTDGAGVDSSVVAIRPPPVLVDDPNVCLDWVHGRCVRDNCRFAHEMVSDGGRIPVVANPPLVVAVSGGSHTSTIVVDDPNVCLDWVHGHCVRDNCKFLHGAAGSSASPVVAVGGGSRLPSIVVDDPN